MNTTTGGGFTARRNESLELSPFQQRVCAIPEEFSIFLGGGRGGAKSHCMAFLALRHAAQYGDKARILYIRQTYKGLADFAEITRELFGRIYGKAVRFNQTEGVWRLPGGGYFEVGQLEGIGDFNKYVGCKGRRTHGASSSRSTSACLLRHIAASWRNRRAQPGLTVSTTHTVRSCCWMRW